MMRRRHFLSLVILPSLAQAHSFELGDILIGHAWALPTESSEAQVMMPLINTGEVVDRLVSATTPIAASVELRGATEFLLEPKRPFPMRAAANHLQLIGLTKPLVKGDKFALTLTFRKAGEIQISVFVAEKPGD